MIQVECRGANSLYEVEQLGFGDHVWNIDLHNVPKLLLYCKNNCR